MGLDMYLEKSIYVGAEYKHRNVKGSVTLSVNGKKLPINVNKITEVVERVAYWRKANQIHNWFVQNCQNGVDNCQRSYVSGEQLVNLRELCKTALATRNPELLPPVSGFFFGSTEIDSYYWDDLRDTIDMLSDIDEACTYYYHASW